MKTRVFSEETLVQMRTKKAIWDVRELREKARFILTISSESEVNLRENHDYAADVFAVFAPSDIGGKRIDETLILEIGIGKGTPYARTFKKNSRGQWLSTDRKKFRDPTDAEKRIIWEWFRKLMIRLTDERRSRWKKTESRIKKLDNGKVIFYNQGQHFIISTDDSWPLNGVIDLEWRYRHKRYFGEYRTWIRFWLRKYKRTYYPEKQAKTFIGLRKAMELLKGVHFRHPYITQRFIESLGANKAALIRNMSEFFGFILTERPCAALWDSLRLSGYHIFIDRVNEKRGVLVFECAPNKIELDDHAKRKLDARFGKGDEPTNDIPFTDEEIAAHRARYRVREITGDIPF